MPEVKLLMCTAGAELAIPMRSVTPRDASSSPESAVIAAGVRCTVETLRWAVTTMSWMLPSPLSSVGVPACAAGSSAAWGSACAMGGGREHRGAGQEHGIGAHHETSLH